MPKRKDMKGSAETSVSLKALRKKLYDAKALMIMVMPHFLPLLEVAEKRREITVRKDVQTAQTYPNGSIEFGYDFLSNLSLEETAFIIAHELGHHYMATFSRERGITDPKTRELINIASDTQINNMVAQYFEAHNYSQIRQLPNIVSGQWWEAERLWRNGRICPVSTDGNKGSDISEQNLCLSLEKLSQKLLPSSKFIEIDALAMEDIVAALEIFSAKAEATGLDDKLRNVLSIRGNIICKQKGFPLLVPINESFGVLDKDTFVCKIDGSKQNNGKNDFSDVIPKISLHIRQENENSLEVQETDFPIDTKLVSEVNEDIEHAQLNIGGKAVFTLSKHLQEYGIPLDIQGEMTVTYDSTGIIKITGTISIHIAMTGIGNGAGSGNSGASRGTEPSQSGGHGGDVKGRDLLKEHDPGITDEEIDKAIDDMENARREASGLVQGNGTSLDVEVRAGLYHVPWQTYLQNWLDGHSRITRTYNRASRRGELDDPRCCLPGHGRVGYRLNIVLDTSGSMTSYLPNALGAIASFCERNAVDCIKIVECDAGLQDIKDISADALRKYTLKGGGGTDMTPGMTAFENDPTATGVIVITDGDIGNGYPNKRLPYDVLWCLVGTRRRIPVPYGKQIHI